jgi:hypothetical protein
MISPAFQADESVNVPSPAVARSASTGRAGRSRRPSSQRDLPNGRSMRVMDATGKQNCNATTRAQLSFCAW